MTKKKLNALETAYMETLVNAIFIKSDKDSAKLVAIADTLGASLPDKTRELIRNGIECALTYEDRYLSDYFPQVGPELPNLGLNTP